MQDASELLDARPDLSEVCGPQLAALDALLAPEWPPLWRELCTSCFVTLRHLAQGGAAGLDADAHDLARLALALTLGLAQDFGGQPLYSPVGAALMSAAKTRRIVAALRSGSSYATVARRHGVTERRVRQIEAAWRAAEMEKRQGKLPL